MRQITINKRHHLITVACFSIFIFSIVAYMYFLSLSVVHVVMRKEGMHNVNQLRSEIAYLEASYIEAKYLVNSQIASISEFNSTADKVFISMAEQSLVLRTDN